MNPVDLPSWIACPLARVGLAHEPSSRFKRVTELAEAYLEYASILALSALNSGGWLDRRLEPVFGEKLGQNLNKVMATGDWVKVFAYVRAEIARIGRMGESVDVLGFSPSQPCGLSKSPITQATEALTGTAVNKPSVGAFFDALVPERNQFSHRTVDDGRSAQLSPILQEAIEAIIADTSGLRGFPLVWVASAGKRVTAGKERFIVNYHKLIGTGLPEAREATFAEKPPALSAGALYFWDERLTAYRLPEWMASYDPHKNLLTCYQGISGGLLVHHSRTSPGVLEQKVSTCPLPPFLGVDGDDDASDTAQYNLAEFLADAPSVEATLRSSADPLRTREGNRPQEIAPSKTRFAAITLEDGSSPFIGACLDLAGRDDVVLGRDPGAGNTLRLPHASVSRRHATVRVDAGRIHIHDLRSRNGVAVNGRVITGTSIVLPGDSIHVGPFVFRLEIVDSEAANRIKRATAISTQVGHDPLTGLVLPRGVPGMMRDACSQALSTRVSLVGIGFHVSDVVDDAKQAVAQAVARLIVWAVPDPERVALTDKGALVAVFVGVDAVDAQRLAEGVCRQVALHDWDRVKPGLVVMLTSQTVEYKPPEPLNTFLERLTAG